MSGIYIHIPFCKKKCHYCDFYITLNKNNVSKLIDAIKFELILRKNFLNKNSIETIYFGGGTPSMISPNYIGNIIKEIKNNFSVNSNIEITIEANPDDISLDNLLKWKKYGINRISLGVQTLNDNLLNFINRSHDKKTAIASIKKISEHYDNFSIDLIYGIPGNRYDKLKNDIKEIIKFNPPHISAYNLTIEKKTVFYNWLKNNIIKKEKEREIIKQFNLLKNILEKEEYIQYETSSFCKKGYESKHNSGYWKRKKYLGIGPSAHSFDGKYRSWNISDNNKYISALNKRIIPNTEEKLSKKMKINEIIMIGIRTKWGIDNKQLITQLKYDILKNQKNTIDKLINDKLIYINRTKIKATKKGSILLDYIAEKLLV